MPQVLKAHVKEEILKSGLSEFYKTGYDKSKIRDIAIKSNVSPGNIYRYFTNKEQLFNAIVTPVYNELKIMFKNLNASGASSTEILVKDFADMLVQITKKHRYEIHIILSNETILPNVSKDLDKMLEDVILAGFVLKSDNNITSNDKIMIKAYTESIKKGIVKIIEETNTKSKLDSLIGDFVKIFF
ncbi:transcriptional regulator, TetR family [Dethiosulfatibacter aminovorans DSM 17477]|uniref:Transcriptional regulator, TetR family n=1 Tax=Dethiosulfatibacter aminovorans DSM 17477 TaxID=1121476 RepID=A0A1M6FXA9_9FIRM|nr:TetR/AcrR family transcriptional regulator [Dethiosulfatibacter aminovorans]SHJ02302.1 transcriptional regulator, TetR family [Dethiosulfatibacter aminovorans DSM 17477]